MIKFNAFGLITEFFISISLLYLIVHGTFSAFSKNFKIIHRSMTHLVVLVLFLSIFLLFNEDLYFLQNSIVNNSMILDYLAFYSKIIIIFASIICFLFAKFYLINQKINNFEYTLLILFSILGLLLLCSSNDLMTAYLSIELQSLSFYILAAFKKNSSFSVEAGLKYFILGAFSSSLFLFGTSFIYGSVGTVHFEDFKDLFHVIIPGNSIFIDIINEHQILMKYIKAPFTNDCFFKYNNDVFVIETQNLYNFILNIKNVDIVNDILNALTNPAICFWVYFQVYFGNSIIDLGLDSVFFSTHGLSSNESFDFLETTHNMLGNEFFLKKYAYFDYDLTAEYAFNYNHVTEEFIGTFNSFKERIFSSYLYDGFNDQKKISEIASYFEPKKDMKYFFNLNFDQDLIFYNNFFDTTLLEFFLIFLFISIFFKLALVPFHSWSPDIYEGSPTSSSFFFSVIPKLAFFVLLFRIFYQSFYGFIDHWRTSIVIIALFSLIVGSFVGLEQKKLKSLLAYSSITNMGYLLIAFSTGTFEGFQALIGFMIIYILSGLCVWSVVISLRLKNDKIVKKNKELTDFVLLSKSNPALAIVMTVALFSIAGIPPMIGFLVKFNIFLASIEATMYFAAFVGAICSVISTFFYVRLIKIFYFEKVLVGKLYHPLTFIESFLLSNLLFLFLFLFLNPTLLYLITYKITLLSLGTFI